MYASKRRQRNFKRTRTVPLGEIGAKCSQDIGQFAEILLQGHGGHHQQHQHSGNVLPSNPSKRHRERLNGELETVASLLPYEESLLQRLDKLSVLRLAVSFLQIKAHFQVCAQQALESAVGCCAEHPLARLHGSPVIPVPTMVNPQTGMASLYFGDTQFAELTQKAMGAFLLMLHLDGDVFYVTENIETKLGFQQSDVLHQSLFEMIHSEDREELRALLQRALEVVSRRDGGGGEGAFSDQAASSDGGWSVSVVLRFRCLLDNSCGFSRIELRCRLISVHSHRVELSPFVPPQRRTRTPTAHQYPPGLDSAQFGIGTSALANSRKYALVAICTPLVPPPQMDPELDDPILKSRHSLDLGFQCMDLRLRHILELDESPSPSLGASTSADPPKPSLYSFVHPDDLRTVAEAHDAAIKYTASGLMIYRLVSANSQFIYFVQSSFRLGQKNGKLDRIDGSHRIITEIDGESLLEKRSTPKFKHFTFDDTLLQSPRMCQSNQQQQQFVVAQQPLQQMDSIGTVDTETRAAASFSPTDCSNLLRDAPTTAKSKKGKKAGKKEANNGDGAADGRRGAVAKSPAGAVPTALTPLFPSAPSAITSTARCLASSQLQHSLQPSSNLSSLPGSACLHQQHHQPPPPPPPSDSVMADNDHLLHSYFAWPNPVGMLASPSHNANATSRLKRFTFERYYAESVDVSPYGCYYYCPSSSSAAGTFTHNNPSSLVDFVPGSANVYPPATGMDYWNSMLAMAAGPATGVTDAYATLQQQQQQQFQQLTLNQSSLIAADPSAQVAAQFQQQFSPAWLNAAGSVFNFAAAASQIWPSPPFPAVDFEHSLASYPHNQIVAHLATAEDASTEEEMAPIDQHQQQQHEQQQQQQQQQHHFGERWTIDKRSGRKHSDRRRDGGANEVIGKRPFAFELADSVGTAPAIGEKNAAPSQLTTIPAQTTAGFLHNSVANATPNASGFRFLTEMAQTLFG
uniref:Aryl hydrocarbon receptor n=1 Tax=Globodera rostochiensis TaxID=31243 RepID=A0A914HC81_GLORO